MAMTRPDALNGIRVIEMTTAIAGPTAGHILGDMGAEVIKVEEPRARSRVAGLAPRIEGAPDRPYNRAALFNEVNRSKRHVSLDLAKPSGRETFLRLVSVSDLVIENFAPRVMPNLGLDYDVLRAANPAIIMVSMPAFGSTGPYWNRASYGPGIDAMGGISHLTGYPDRAPGKPANYFSDQAAGLHAVFAALTALRHRRRTGEGQRIELAMLEGDLQFVAPALMDYVMNGRVQSRIGNRHPVHAPQGVYSCTGNDEWVAISVATDEEWQTLCRILGDDSLANNAGLATAAGRQAAHDDIDTAISRWTSTHTKEEVQETLQAAGVSAGAVLAVEELFHDRQLLHRESFVWVDHPETGRFPHTRAAWRSRSRNHGVRSPAPLYGEGLRYVFGTLLEMTDAEIASLIEEGVTTDEPTEVDI